MLQRPQHLMSAFAKSREVTFWEEPVHNEDVAEAGLRVRRCGRTGVEIVVPELPRGLSAEEERETLRRLLHEHTATQERPWIRWYYTPMMLPISRELRAACTVYDCMDELANFRFAPPELATLEVELFGVADVVFTGGYSLYEAKRGRHDNMHPFPSSIDARHFAPSDGLIDPTDQASLPRPRLGFYGVIDERMDLDLLRNVATTRPDWTLVLVGPVVKISEADLPRLPNIHYLGQKTYEELPHYLSGWDVALMPFAINESTRFISPTKTPEYLAGMKPVVSTPIRDVERHYGHLQAVKIARSPEDFVSACEQALQLAQKTHWRNEIKELLRANSWQSTASRMQDLVEQHLRRGPVVPLQASPKARRASEPYDYLVVGAGFAGSVVAERLATQLGKRVLVIDRRPHIGGNAYDFRNEAGVLTHLYGPHIFHTNSDAIFDYLGNFTDWRPYEHRVLARIGDLVAPMPINRTTLNRVYGVNLATEQEAAAFLAAKAEPREAIRTSEDVVISTVGRELYEKFFRGYTRKQWGLDPSELDKSVTSRVPTRTNTDDRYFTDQFQAMPRDGYTKMFARMLDQPGIDIALGEDFEDVRRRVRYRQLIYTGPIDEYFHYLYGRLPYRSLRFQHETLACEQFQPVGVVNYPEEHVPYTRVTEYKHLTGQKHPCTTITYEYPSADGDPFYPIPKPENQALYKKYEALALAEPETHFVGRLATYRYYNMDQVVGQALTLFKRLAAAEDGVRATPTVAALRSREAATGHSAPGA